MIWIHFYGIPDNERLPMVVTKVIVRIGQVFWWSGRDGTLGSSERYSFPGVIVLKGAIFIDAPFSFTRRRGQHMRGLRRGRVSTLLSSGLQKTCQQIHDKESRFI